jgi:tripartite-type tricarboxylate transporter receptor subunit TctC
LLHRFVIDNVQVTHIEAGRARPFAGTTTERVTQLPDIRMMADTVPGFECTTRVSIFASAALIKAIVDQLDAELGKDPADPTIASKLSIVTYHPVHKTPEELGQRMKTGFDSIGKLFQEFNVRIDQR